MDTWTALFKTSWQGNSNRTRQSRCRPVISQSRRAIEIRPAYTIQVRSGRSGGNGQYVNEYQALIHILKILQDGLPENDKKSDEEEMKLKVENLLSR